MSSSENLAGGHPAASAWSDARDARLLTGRAAGESFARIGEALGVSKSAAIARWSRLKGRPVAWRNPGPDRGTARDEACAIINPKRDARHVRKLLAAGGCFVTPEGQAWARRQARKGAR